MLLLKKQLKSSTFYLLCALSVLLLGLFQFIVFPDARQTGYGIYCSCENSRDSILSVLDGDDVFHYVLFDTEEELKSVVRSGRVDCGFILLEKIDSISDPEDLKSCAVYVSSTSTTKGALLKEKVFAAVLHAVSEHMLETTAFDPAIYKEPGQDIADFLLDYYHYYLDSDEILQVVFEEIDPSDTAAGNASGDSAQTVSSSRSKLLTKEETPEEARLRSIAICLILIFSASLVFARYRFDRENRQIHNALRGWQRGYWSFICVLAPTLLLSVVMAPSELYLLSAADALTTRLVVRCILLCLGGALICSLWSCIYSSLFRSEMLYLSSLTMVILLAILTCEPIIKASTILPALRILKYVFPVNYLL